MKTVFESKDENGAAYGSDENLFNARLIAAPDLLAALKDLHKNISFLRDSIEGDERLELDGSLDLILKAIKKATE